MPKSRVPEVPSVPESKIEDDLDVDGGTADEEAVRKEGALNVAAAQAGRRERDAIGKKRAGTARVSFGDDNACLLYDATVQLYAAPTLAILVERTSGSSRLSWYLHSEPANGAALYQAIQVQCHGRSEESVYKVTLKDKAAKTWRGVGWLTLPNTLGDMPVLARFPGKVSFHPCGAGCPARDDDSHHFSPTKPAISLSNIAHRISSVLSPMTTSLPCLPVSTRAK